MAWGFVDGGSGLLNPRTYEYEPGSSTAITWLVVFTDGDDFLRLSARNPDGLNGLWLKLGDDLAVEMDAAERLSVEREWKIPEGSLDWSDRADVEVSLWDAQPPGTDRLPRELWSGSMTVGQGPRTILVGYKDDEYGSLVPNTFEHEPGSTVTITQLRMSKSTNDLLSLISDDMDSLDGLWLRLNPDVAVRMTPANLGIITGWSWSLGRGTLGWSVGDVVEVSLWDKDPRAG